MFSPSADVKAAAGLEEGHKLKMQLRGRRIPSAKTTEDNAPHELTQSNGIPPGSPSSPPTPQSLSLLSRLYLYSLHGCLAELLFTSVWDFCFSRDVRLQGHSSLWTLPMYSTALLVLERIRQKFLDRNLLLPLRLAAYTAFIYLWEFTWGAGLSLIGACPWDYSGFKYNFQGLITLEYALFWAVAAFIAEKFVIKNILRIQM